MKRVDHMKHVIYVMLLLSTTGKIVQKKPAVSLFDKKFKTEPYFLSFIWESKLPMHLTPRLVQLYKDVSIGNRALNKVNFSCPSATYEKVDGLVISKNRSVISKMQNCPFL